MKEQQLRAIIVMCALNYAEEYNTSNFTALYNISAVVYSFVKSYSPSASTKTKSEFIDSIIDFILGSDLSITDTEFECLEYYYKGYSAPDTFEYEITDEFRSNVSDYRAKIKRIIASTEEMRHIFLKAKVEPVLDRIDDFVSYNELVDNDGKTLFYIKLYLLGLIDGKRQERARRKIG